MILVVAAFEPELSTLDAALTRDIVGVGLVEAALGAARAITRHAPRHVVLVGTVGAYPNAGLAIGDVIVAERVLLVAASGAMPSIMPTSLEADARFPGRRVTVATTLSITTDDAIAISIEGETSAHVEHLEAFAVARACAESKIRFSAVLGVANFVGSRGRDEWREHHERAAAAACAVLRSPTTMPSPA